MTARRRGTMLELEKERCYKVRCNVCRKELGFFLDTGNLDRLMMTCDSQACTQRFDKRLRR
jgi:Zn-finger nucleic acid-binding protein